ncbi:MAG TPA: DUF2460 domain-containing protein [Caulobacteraceae bacterium]|nr:DUF2460 domain-containing protein [Caulobacteraceae bacterium]
MPITPFVPPSFLTSLPTAIWSGADGLPVLPYLPGQAITVSKAPKWSTQVVHTASGRERRTAYWPYPLWQFALQYEVVRHRPSQAELFALWEFFNVMKGQYLPFLFVDPSDCQVPTSVLLDTAGNPLLDSSGGLILDGSGGPLGFGFGTGDGVTTSFQLTRQIASFVEPVFSAYNPTILDNSAIAGANTVSQGVVTFSTAPAAGHVLVWLGYFYFGCRFAQDDLSFEQIVQQLWAGKALKFTSIRP